jgi:hypothetical protein
LSYLLASDGFGATAPGLAATDHAAGLSSRAPHFNPRANAVIVLLQNGGPSQMDLFDPKPELQKREGQKHSERIESFQPGGESNALMASAFKFSRHGQCGMDFSELLPHLATLADDLCLVRSMYSDNNNHPQALRCINTGKIFPGRPTLGAWVSYALGTENQNLPAYVVLRDPDGGLVFRTWRANWKRRVDEIAVAAVSALLPPARAGPASRPGECGSPARANRGTLEKDSRAHLLAVPFGHSKPR